MQVAALCLADIIFVPRQCRAVCVFSIGTAAAHVTQGTGGHLAFEFGAGKNGDGYRIGFQDLRPSSPLARLQSDLDPDVERNVHKHGLLSVRHVPATSSHRQLEHPSAPSRVVCVRISHITNSVEYPRRDDPTIVRIRGCRRASRRATAVEQGRHPRGLLHVGSRSRSRSRTHTHT